MWFHCVQLGSVLIAQPVHGNFGPSSVWVNTSVILPCMCDKQFPLVHKCQGHLTASLAFIAAIASSMACVIHNCGHHMCYILKLEASIRLHIAPRQIARSRDATCRKFIISGYSPTTISGYSPTNSVVTHPQNRDSCCQLHQHSVRLNQS
jgi:hypothetical protein